VSVAPALVAHSDFLGALAGARDVALSAYVLAPGGTVCRALESAAEGGASVTVTLEAFADRPATDTLRRLAGITERALEAHGVRVRAGVGGETCHLKAAVLDGIAYLDDRNWTTTGETLVATSDPEQVAAIRSAIDGGLPAAHGDLALEKAAALELEAAAIRTGTGDHIDLASESFGWSEVAKALRERAQGGAHVRLLVNGKIAASPHADSERAILHRLAAQGVEVRLTPATEKLCTAGDRGWVGSANATFEFAPTTDWGLAVHDAPTLDALAKTFDREWSTARAFV
jgi:phosphatidylserine/phosphatidylglycerophosphate/cardiolipin synthase-like enzyme